MNRSRDVLLFIGGMIFQQIVAFGASILVARALGPADYGLLSLSRNVFTVLMILAPLGLDLALLRHIAQHKDDPAAMARQVTALRFLILSITAALLTMVYFVLGPLLEARFYRYPGFAAVLSLTCLAAPFAADVALLGAVFRAWLRPALQVVVSLYLQPAVRFCLIVLFLTLGFGLAGVLVATALGFAVASLVLSVLLLRWNRRLNPRRHALDQGDWRDIRRLLSDSSWLALSLLVMGTLRNMDVIVLGAWRPANEVGEYAAISLVAQTIQFFPASLSQTLGAVIARQHMAGQSDEMKATLSRYLRQASLIAAPVFAGVAVFGPWLDLVFGQRFHFRGDVALVLAAGYYLSAILGPMGFSLSMTGRHRLEFSLLLTGTLVALAASIPCTQAFGAIGIASVTGAAFITISAARALLVQRIHGFFVGSWVDLAPSCIALAAGYAVREFGSALIGRSLTSLIVLAGCYLLLCSAALWPLLSRTERRLVTDRLRLGKNPGTRDAEA